MDYLGGVVHRIPLLVGTISRESEQGGNVLLRRQGKALDPKVLAPATTIHVRA